MIDIEQVKKIAKAELEQEQFLAAVQIEKERLRNKKSLRQSILNLLPFDIVLKGRIDGYRALITCQKEKIDFLLKDNQKLQKLIERLRSGNFNLKRNFIDRLTEEELSELDAMEKETNNEQKKY